MPLVIIDTNILVDALIDRIAKKLHLVGEISLDIQGQGSFHKILLSKAKDKKLQLWLPDVVKQELIGIASGLNHLRSRFDDSLVSPELLDKIFLKVLKNNPEKMPEIFHKMFQSSANTVIKFLSNKSNFFVHQHG